MIRDKYKLLELIKEKDRRQRTNKFKSFFPESGPLSRHQYPKHLQFFETGSQGKNERGLIAANRAGKTVAGAYELTCHATGLYPDWWVGKRFDKPCSIWASGDTAETVRDIGQLELLGPIEDMGTGMIPGDLIIGTPPRKPGIPNAIELVHVRHKTGGVSTIGFKGYAKGRISFQGTAKDIIWLDEEPPMDVYTECLMRTMTTGGQVLATFTPLKGLSEVVLSFMPGGKIEGTPDTKALVTLTWDDAPHLSDEDKEKLFASIPPHQRDARSKGIPALGSGAIYPVPESEIVCEPREIPLWWPRAYGLDVGWNNTACLWGAVDPETGITYLYHEYKKGQAEPVIHAQAIRSPGEWIQGVIDPAARGRSQRDGESLLDNYNDLGLMLEKANNAVEAGLYDVWGKLSTGRIKVFKTLTKFLDEYRIYRRDENGRIVKENDHIMDCLRYLVMSGLQIATTKPYEEDYSDSDYGYRDDARNASTGY